MQTELPAVQSPTPFHLGSQTFDVAGVSSAASGSTTLGSGTGGTAAGRAEFDSLAVEKMVDVQTLELAHAVAAGVHLPEARYEAPGLGVILRDVMVNGITIDSSLEENISVNYADVEWISGGNRFRWNILENKVE